MRDKASKAAVMGEGKDVAVAVEAKKPTVNEERNVK